MAPYAIMPGWPVWHGWKYSEIFFFSQCLSCAQNDYHLHESRNCPHHSTLECHLISYYDVSIRQFARGMHTNSPTLGTQFLTIHVDISGATFALFSAVYIVWSATASLLMYVSW